MNSHLPLTAEQRADRYRRQNGTRKLTGRQRRRIAKKEGRLGNRPIRLGIAWHAIDEAAGR